MNEKLTRSKGGPTGPGGPEVQVVQGPESRIVPPPEAGGSVVLTQRHEVSESPSGPVVSRSSQERQSHPTRIQQGVQSQSFLNFVYKKFAEQIASGAQFLLNRARPVALYFLKAFSKKEPPAVPVGA